MKMNESFSRFDFVDAKEIAIWRVILSHFCSIFGDVIRSDLSLRSTWTIARLSLSFYASSLHLLHVIQCDEKEDLPYEADKSTQMMCSHTHLTKVQSAMKQGKIKQLFFFWRIKLKKGRLVKKEFFFFRTGGERQDTREHFHILRATNNERGVPLNSTSALLWPLDVVSSFFHLCRTCAWKKRTWKRAHRERKKEERDANLLPARLDRISPDAT